MVMNFKNKIRHCEKLQIRQKSLMRSCKHTNTVLFIEENSIVMWARPTLAC